MGQDNFLPTDYLNSRSSSQDSKERRSESQSLISNLISKNSQFTDIYKAQSNQQQFSRKPSNLMPNHDHHSSASLTTQAKNNIMNQLVTERGNN